MVFGEIFSVLKFVKTVDNILKFTEKISPPKETYNTVLRDPNANRNFEAEKKLKKSSKEIVATGNVIKENLVIREDVQKLSEETKQGLQEMSEKIQELTDQMTYQFNELKAFITVHHFSANCVTPVLTMMKYLQMVIETPCHDTFGMFRENCQSPTPLRCAMDLISLLEQDVTNPLKKAMEVDPMRTTATFRKWQLFFNELLGKLLILECMVNGMFWAQNMIGPDKLCEEIVEFQDLMDDWEDEYRNDKNGYWPAVKSLRDRVEEKYDHLGNKEKAEFLEKELGKILTNHAFYIIVYDYCESFGQLSITHSDQLLESSGTRNCCIVIYRSFEMNNGHSKTSEDLKQLENQVEACRHNTLPEDVWQSEFAKTLQKNRLSNTGFVALIRQRRNPVIRHVNSWREWGPGWWITAYTQNEAHWILIAGYR